MSYLQNDNIPMKSGKCNLLFCFWETFGYSSKYSSLEWLCLCDPWRCLSEITTFIWVNDSFPWKEVSNNDIKKISLKNKEIRNHP